MRERLKILVFAAAVGSILGSIDYLIGLSYAIYELRGQGLSFLLVAFVLSQLLYAAMGAGFGLVTLIAVDLYRFLRSAAAPAERQLHLSGTIAGTMSGIFVALLFEAYAKIHSNWGLFLDFALFIPIGAAAGYGIKICWDRFLKNFLGAAMPGILILALSALLSAMFVLFWVLKGPLSITGRLAMVFATGVIFAASVLMGRMSLSKKSAGITAAYAFFAVLLLSLPLWSREPARKYEVLGKPQNPLNIIFIIADACRADAVGIYAGKNQTPNIDRLAREGVLFKNAYSQARWTFTSMLSMLSSLYPSMFVKGKTFLPPNNIEFIAERLKAYGYRNQAEIGNYILGGSSGIHRGFDRAVVIRHDYRLQRLFSCPVILKTHYLARRFLGLSQLPDTTAMITAKAMKFLDRRDEPFFLWLHFMNPHDPYNPPDQYLREIKYRGYLKPPFNPFDPFHLPEDQAHPQERDVRLGYALLTNNDKNYMRDLYLAQLRYLDEKIGEIIRKVESRGLAKNTVIIFAADHGEQFWEHGQQGHSTGLYDELIHTPLIIWGAGLKPGIVDQQVQMLDLAPTLAELIGIPPNPVWQGKSFYPALNRGTISSRPVFAEGLQMPEEMQMVRAGQYKLIVGLFTGRSWLFDLKKDPLEQRDIYSEKSSAAKELKARIADWDREKALLESRLHPSKARPEQQKELDERLRALGYLK